MEYTKNKRENIFPIHKLYTSEIDNNSTDFTEKLNESNKFSHEKLIGNYIIEKLLNKGRKSKVFLAKHIITEEKVAIKILDKKLFKSDILSLKHIKKEIQILKMVKHENIIKLLEIIENNNKIYLIKNYYLNELLSLIAKNKKLSEEKALYYFSQFINGLHYLHENGICHRNIRPDNLLLDENYEKLKIIDFGLSTKYAKNELLNSPVGAIIYAPPEMHLSEKYSGELIDIWNAGLVLYIMVCGCLPFNEEDEERNINHIITGLYEIPSNVSNYCTELIKSCLQVDPNKRINFEKLNNFINYTKGLIFDINLIPLDENIIEECRRYLGNNNEDKIDQVEYSVKNNIFNEFNSLYYLLLKKMKRNGYESISDLSSNKFKYYISNFDPLNESGFVFKEKKSTNFIYKKSNINKINKSYINDRITKESLKNASYKKNIFCSPLTINNYVANTNSFSGRNDRKNKKFTKPVMNENNMSCKNIMKAIIKLDNINFDINNNSDCKIKNVISISPNINLNKTNKNNLSSKFFIKKILLNSYSSWKNSKISSDAMNRYNNSNNNNNEKENNLIDRNNLNNTNFNIYNSTLLSSMRDLKNLKEKLNSNENIHILRNKNNEEEKNRKTISFMKKIKDISINKNINIYERKTDFNKNFYSEKIDINNKTNNFDENNDNSMNILTEDKPLENFKISNNFCSNNLNGNKYNIYNKFNETHFSSNSNNIIIDDIVRKKLKVKKKAIKRGASVMIKNVAKDKRNNDGFFQKENRSISIKNNIKLIGKQKIIQKNIIKSGNNYYIIHKKNKTPSFSNNIFDYKNKTLYLKEKDKHLENDNINEKNNKNSIDLECYKTNSYEIGVLDLCCLKIESLDNIKENINNGLKIKKIKYNNVKNNKYKCYQLGNIFEIEVLTLDNFLYLNNIKNNKKENIPLSKKENKQNKKSLSYIIFKTKKNDIKKCINSFLKEI